MPDTNINIRTEKIIKTQAEEIFAEFGLNMTTAINMFLRQTIRDKKIPFELTLVPPVRTNSKVKKGDNAAATNGEA